MIQQTPASLLPGFCCLPEQWDKLSERGAILLAGRYLLFDEDLQIAPRRTGVLFPEPITFRATTWQRIALGQFSEYFVRKTLAPRLFQQITVGEQKSIDRTVSKPILTTQRTADFLTPGVENFPSIAYMSFRILDFSSRASDNLAAIFGKRSISHF